MIWESPKTSEVTAIAVGRPISPSYFRKKIPLNQSSSIKAFENIQINIQGAAVGSSLMKPEGFIEVKNAIAPKRMKDPRPKSIAGCVAAK